MSAIANANKVPSIPVIGISESDPVPDYILKYGLGGSDANLTRFGTDDFRIAKAGKQGVGSWFDGSTQYYSANPDSDKIAVGTGAFTISAWINARNITALSDIFSNGDGNSPNEFRVRLSSVGKLQFRVNSQSRTSLADVDDGNWRHVAVTCVGSGNPIVLYVDGSLDVSASSLTYDIQDSGDLAVGVRAGLITGLFNGGIDDVRFYDRALPPTEITTLFDYIVDFNPSQITTTTWYDAQDQTTITESLGAVSQLDDKSGNSHHMLQAVGAEQPPTFLDTVGGLNTITFNVSGISLRATAPISVVGKVVVAVWKGYGNGTGLGIILADTAINNQVMRWLTNNTNGRLSSYDSSTEVTFDPATDRKFVPNVLAIEYDVNRELFINGEPSPSNPYAFDGSIQFDAIGELAGNPSNADGLFCELVVCDPSERQEVEGYLAWKWINTSSLGVGNPNLPMGHPYKYQPPKFQAPNGFGAGFSSGFE